MIKIIVERPEQLTPAKRQEYAALLESKLSSRLFTGRNPMGIKSGELLLLGAYAEDRLIGCLSYSVYKGLFAADLLYISVLPEFRQQGIGLSLLNFLKEDLIQRNVHVCWAMYIKEDPFTSTLQDLFAKTGWGEPHHEIIRLFLDAWEYVSPYSSYPLPKGCEIFKWTDLTDDERATLKFKDQQRSFPEHVSPFSTKYAIEPLNSLGIRCEGEIIAWLITHRVNKETIRFSVFYVSPEYRRTACFLELGNIAIAAQHNSPIQWAMCEINFTQGHSTWRRFAMRELAPHAKKIENIYISTLNLKELDWDSV
ncbi:MAG: GNAT family N-acetyltransferase [Parachlamydiales bacterium]|jgi:GNAT superfamily N-acetyltransferase